MLGLSWAEPLSCSFSVSVFDDFLKFILYYAIWMWFNCQFEIVCKFEGSINCLEATST
jgi:hypothetical protein